MCVKVVARTMGKSAIILCAADGAGAACHTHSGGLPCRKTG